VSLAEVSAPREKAAAPSPWTAALSALGLAAVGAAAVAACVSFAVLLP